MIRRDSEKYWLLISQVEHARIAAELAEPWGDQALQTFPRRSELLSAIRHHDDGWTAWERAPTLNEHGEPRDFTEMPMSVATAIWTRSIEPSGDDRRESAYGELWVSRHFCHLAEGALDSRESAEDRAAIDEFLSLQASVQCRWRQQLEDSSSNLLACEEFGYHWLQTFDRISLWLCCAHRDERWRVMLPSGVESDFVPVHGELIAVEPFPFAAPITLQVDAVRIRRQVFQEDSQFHAAVREAPRDTVRWHLCPGTGR